METKKNDARQYATALLVITMRYLTAGDDEVRARVQSAWSHLDRGLSVEHAIRHATGVKTA